jgi:hypothetical protein
MIYSVSNWKGIWINYKQINKYIASWPLSVHELQGKFFSYPSVI